MIRFLLFLTAFVSAIFASIPPQTVLTDALGSTRGLVVNNAEVLTDFYDYKPYGEIASHTGSSTNSFLFAGEQLDLETNNYYLRARYYSPTLTRFLSRDTYDGKASDPLSQNHYFYAGGNPIVYVDPSGNFFTMADVSMALSAMSYMRTSLATSFIVRSGMFYGMRAILNLYNFIYGGPVITLGVKSGVRWGFWKDLPKVVYRGTKYALVRGKLYAEHAVYRMTPNGFGGRGIPTIVVENAIAFGKTTAKELVRGGIKYTKIFENVKVIYKKTIDGREVIITVIKLSSKGKK